MTYRILTIWLEGKSRDQTFFSRIVEPILKNSYDHIDYNIYCGDEIRGKKRRKKIFDYITSWESINKKKTGSNFEYIFVHDFDQCVCITNKKRWIKKLLPIVDEKKIIIVKNEIESWYLSGLCGEDCKKIGIHEFNNTENVTQEMFDNIKTKQFEYDSEFLSTILNHFSIKTAKRKNQSFNYFARMYNLG